MQDRWRSVDEIADYLGVSKDTVYAWVTQKGMPGHKVGRFWKFKQQDVDDWVRAGGAASNSDELGERKPDVVKARGSFEGAVFHCDTGDTRDTVDTSFWTL